MKSMAHGAECEHAHAQAPHAPQAQGSAIETTETAVVRLRPGLDNELGLRAGEVATVTEVSDDPG